jgi:hypothetical protein
MEATLAVDQRVGTFLLQSPAEILDLERVGANLEKTITKVLRRVPTQDSVLLAWPMACGTAVADRTRATRFSEGVLYVEVSDPGWRRELSALAGRYLASLNRYSTQPVNRIEFQVRR